MTPWADATPRRWQLEALDAVLGAWRAGEARPLVQACTGAGKSRLIGALAASGRGRVLITTPTQALVEQLAGTIAEHVGAEHVGQAYQHAWQIDRRVVVTCLPSLPRLLDTSSEWACWVADEAHRVEGDSGRDQRERIVSRVRVGLTATAFRADDRGLLWGSLVYRYASTQAVADGVLVPWRRVVPGRDMLLDEQVTEWLAAAEGPGIISAKSIADAEALGERLEGVEAVHGGQSREVQRATLERLRLGELRAVVHCQLLTEGVDLPWLRWLILRRPTRSRVRLVQEVGRVLRSAPGKSEAVLYDPHDLLGEVGLVHAAQLDDLGEPEAREAAAADEWDVPPLELPPAVHVLPRGYVLDRLGAWAGDVVTLLRDAGLAEPPKYDVGPWRRKRASDKQRAALAKFGWASTWLGLTPRLVQTYAEDPATRAGACSDLFGALLAVAKVRGKKLPALPALQESLL